MEFTREVIGIALRFKLRLVIATTECKFYFLFNVFFMSFIFYITCVFSMCFVLQN